ncbi:MAG: DUF3857 domain-containing protein, partial [Cyclobacteriaceae bacterium]|nr:DUF3857 domain-containing protein [Cyclobacteriaceae bacterium]
MQLNQFFDLSEKTKFFSPFMYVCYMIAFLMLASYEAYCQSGNEVVEYTSHVSLKGTRLVEEESYLIQINNKASDWISDVSIPYSTHDKFELLEASVLNRYGQVIRTIKKKEIIRQSAFNSGTFYSDRMICKFPLKHGEYPYRIYYKYRNTVENFVFLTYWTPFVRYDVPTQRATLTLEIEENLPVTIKAQGNMDYSTRKMETDEGMIRHQWVANAIPRISVEPMSPPLPEIIPTVRVIPQTFVYDIEGSAYDWAGWGDWHDKLNEGLDILTEDEVGQIRSLVSGMADKKEIVRTLYHYLQDNTRYINVAIDVGGLKPYPATYVSANKYGDCKGLTNYMKSLLKAVGIEAYYMTIYAGENPVRVLPDMPGHQSNHVILCVPLETDTLWLENTANFLPANYLGTFTQNRYGLLVNGTKSQLFRTPALSPEDVRENTSVRYEVDINGTGKVIFSSVYKGSEFEYLANLHKSYTARDKESVILKNYIPLATFTLDNWEIRQEDRDEASIQLERTVSVANLFRKAGNT